MITDIVKLIVKSAQPGRPPDESRVKFVLARVAWIPASLACAATAFAQTTDASATAETTTGTDVALSEVVVNAQRRDEKLQSVAISITAITADQIQTDRVEGVADYLGMTPNVSFVDNGSRDRVDITIRGISNDLNPYSDIRPSSFAFYVDDFNVAAITTNPQVVDLGRIEILRGPQGTYFGRNAEGGAINIYTRSPSDQYSAEAGVDYSSFNTVKAYAIGNIPVIPGLFALRLSGQTETSDGNIKNINPTGGGNNSDYYTGRIVARYTPVDNLVWDTTLDYSHENVGMRDGVPTGNLTATWRSVYYHNAPGLANADGVGFFPQNTDEVNFNTPQSIGTNYYYASSRAVYKFDRSALTVVGGYGASTVFNYGDVDGSRHDYFNEVDILKRNTSSLEARLASTTQGSFDWTVGVNGGRDTGKTSQSTTYGSQVAQLGFNRPEGFQITGNYNNQADGYESAFAQGTYHLGSLFDFVLGGRYTHETVSGTFLTLSNEKITNNEPNRSASFNDFSPAATVKFKPLPDMILYATVSKGFKTGGVQSSATVLQNNYSPETLWNYEGGIKYELFNHRLRFDLSGFHERWTNVQEAVNFLYLNSAGTLLAVSGTANAASARSDGFDGSVDFRLDQHITINGRLGYDKANFISYTNALVDGKVINASGEPLLDAPKYTAGSTVEYRRDIFNSQGFGQLDWSYRSQTYSNLYALRYQYYPFIAPGYSNVNLRLGVEKGNVSAIFYVENLLNARYFTNSYEKAFYSGVQVVPSYQRIGFSLTYKM
jgi:iron complex outermembrane receptor protein